MAVEPTTEDAELQVLRLRLAEQERDHAERVKQVNAALAAAQDKSYWLDRWQLDLNELMRRPGASEARAAVRVLRGAYRRLYNLRQRTRQRVTGLPLRLNEARLAAQEERQVAHVGGGAPLERTISPDPPSATPVTDVLYERVGPSAVEEVETRLTSEERNASDAAPPSERRRLVLGFGVHHNVAAVLDRTGLRNATPPSEIHAMERGSGSAGGSMYYADMVVEAALETGFDLAPGKTALDFGSSSGRVVRVLAAAYPEMIWHGCDPIAEAVDWARANLPGVKFERSPVRPPLSYSDQSLDLVFAISIWSHFAEEAALHWLDEMRRVLRPDGRLILTSHGAQSVVHASANLLRKPSQLEEISQALYRDGFWFMNEFGPSGDHGLQDAQWGTAFLSPEWLLRRTSGTWKVNAFHPGRVQDNQDLYVLEPSQ